MIHLAPAEREIIDMYLTGWTAQAIAEHRGNTRNTIISQIERVRARLRQRGHNVHNKIRLTEALKKEHAWTEQ